MGEKNRQALLLKVEASQTSPIQKGGEMSVREGQNSAIKRTDWRREKLHTRRERPQSKGGKEK